ncbi:membrane-anchored junction protein [Natator depressus]|uniref:membrane-anchored junction protein n=1 Tax=Natator depressus TaxID=27790 RepID=UPI003EBAC3F4
MFLKPFTYPVPETRFLHAGRSVYKLKIRYGNFLSSNDIDNNETTTKELEEAIRVIIGNLDNLHPFATERLTIFPYLSKWERVSKLRFKHGDTFLAPYPHVCTMYVELNSFQQNIFVDDFSKFQDLFKRVASELRINLEEVPEQQHELTDILQPSSSSRIALPINPALLEPAKAIWQIPAANLPTCK